MKFYKKLIIVILLGVGIFFVIRNLNSYSYVLEKNWDISIPRSSETLYKVNEDDSVFGDGCRYHILECNVDKDSADMNLKPYVEISSHELSEITDILDSLEVPDDKRPKSIDLYYKTTSGEGPTSDKLYLLVDSENENLYVIESFY